MVVQINRSKADRRGSVLSSGFNDEIIFVKFRHLIFYLLCLALIGYNVYVVWLDKRSDPCYCLLYEAFPPINTKDLFGHSLPAQRPEARAAPAGHDDYVDIIQFHPRIPSNTPCLSSNTPL